MIGPSTSFWNILNIFELIFQLIFVVRLLCHPIATNNRWFFGVCWLTSYSFVFSWCSILRLSLIQILRQDLVLTLPTWRILHVFILSLTWASDLTLLYKMLTVQLMNNIGFFHLNIIDISLGFVFVFFGIETMDLLRSIVNNSTRQHLRRRILFLVCLGPTLNKFLELLFVFIFLSFLVQISSAR